jgi:hypothetical protein
MVSCPESQSEQPTENLDLGLDSQGSVLRIMATNATFVSDLVNAKGIKLLGFEFLCKYFF